MKLLVLSDSHRNKFGLSTVIEENMDADMIVFLGDGNNDFDECEYELPEIQRKRIMRVRGNCDLFSMLDLDSCDIVAGKRILATHGHYQYVKEGYDRLVMFAKENKADLVMFGHTHRPTLFEKDGIVFFNPGAMMDGRYGIITIGGDGKIECRHMGR